MSRQPRAYSVPMTPITPAWADRLGANKNQNPRRLLPSALEMTPPQSAARKHDERASARAHEHDGPAFLPPPPFDQPASALPLSAYSPTSAQYNIYLARKPELLPRSFAPRMRIPPPRISKPKVDGAARFRKCYENYNHYIMRQVVEDKTKVIWPPEVEAVFMEALWLIPGTSRKIMVGQKTRGRNEIIADYLEFELGEKRSRKQVSSHLQVLKKLLVDDQEFLDVVGPKRDSEKPKSKERSSSEMAVDTFGQLVAKLKAAKRGQQKPAFLLQAQYNAQQSRDPEIVHSMSMNVYAPHLKLYSDVQPHRGAPSIIEPKIELAESARAPSPDSLTESETTPPGANAHPGARPTVTSSPASVHSLPTIQLAPATSNSSHRMPPPPGPPLVAPLSTPLAAALPSPMPVSRTSPLQSVALADPPLRYPKPLHSDELPGHVDALVAPPASVPPHEEQPAPFLRVPTHRRTASASVDLSGDKVLPVQFRLLRRNGSITHVYSRLLRPSYESPTNPLPVQYLLPRFAELRRMLAAGELGGVQVVHAMVRLSVKPMLGVYMSDVQFMVTRDTDAQHRYYVKTTVSSRGNDLLTCDSHCAFQSMAGRGLEQDKDLISVPYLPDFFTDFLHRVESASPAYVASALEALNMCQAVYRSTAEGEELCFLALYQFSSAEDEFSARTRFKRVSGIPPRAEAAAAPDQRDVPNTPSRRTTQFLDQDSAMSALTGTPGSFMSLGPFSYYDNPTIMPSPRRNHLEGLDLTMSPLNIAMAESRGSPRIMRGDIQRPMTAFEPSVWDEFPDWVYQ